jgi:hypothetical protein
LATSPVRGFHEFRQGFFSPLLLAALAALKKSLLHQAFNGEL